MRQSNILDSIHDTLEADVWLDPGGPTPQLRPQLRTWIIDLVRSVIRKSEFGDPDAWLSLVFTGSLTTYQYSPESDCDVSLFVDSNVLPDWDRAKLISLMIDNVDGTTLPGTTHPMQGFVVPKEIAREDLYQEGLRSGYDVIEDEWVIPPDKSRVHDVEREYNAYYVYALESADKMERLLRYEPEKAIKFWHQIHKRRQRDQRAGKGDYSESNIVYKFLANRGLFPKISEVSGEYIAKTKQRQEQKFVYDPTQKKLFVAPFAALEGEGPSHYQIMDSIGWEPGTPVMTGTINEPGWVQFYNNQGTTPRMRWQAQEAIRRAVPHAQFMNPEKNLWDEEDWGTD
jgi:hypothetical protein